MATMATCLGGNHVQSQDKPLRNHPTSSLTSRVGANIVNIVSHARPRRWRGNWWNNETWFCSDFKIAHILINCVVTLISASGKCDTQQTQLFPEKLFQKHSSLFCWHRNLFWTLWKNKAILGAICGHRILQVISFQASCASSQTPDPSKVGFGHKWLGATSIQGYAWMRHNGILV